MQDTAKAVLFLGAVATTVTVTTIHSIKSIRREEAKRAAIRADQARQLQAIAEGAEILKMRMDHGYRPSNIQELMTELKFEQIVAYNKNK